MFKAIKLEEKKIQWVAGHKEEKKGLKNPQSPFFTG